MNDYTPSLRRLASLAQQRHGYLAGLLEIYQEQEGVDDQQLAILLGGEVSSLPRLALCQRPRSVSHFRQDIERIAQYAHVQPVALARLVRSAEAIEQSRQNESKTFFLAARDYHEVEEENSLHKDRDGLDE
jgi:hypothetical protein